MLKPRTIHQLFLCGLVFFTIPLTGCAFSAALKEDAFPFFGQPLSTTSSGKAYAYYLAGILAERQGDWEQAKKFYTSVIREDKMAVAPRLQLITVLFRLGSPDKAIEACEKALQTIRNSPELWVIYGELNTHLGNIEKAVTAFETAIALCPDDLTTYGHLLELQEQTNDHVASIEIYEKLLEKSPDSAAFHFQLGLLLTRIRDFKGAQQSFERVLEIDPRIQRARFLLAVVLFEQADFENCVNQLRVYLDNQPDNTEAQAYYACALYRLNQTKQADYIFERLALTDKLDPKICLQLSWILLHKGEWERAQQMALDGNAYLLADFIFYLSQHLTSEELNWASNPWDDRYTFDEVDTECDRILYAWSELLGKEALGSVVLDTFAPLRESLGFSPVLEFFCARLLLYSEKYVEALNHFDSLRERGFLVKQALYHSASIYEKWGQFKDAEFHLTTLLSLDPNFAEALNFLGYMYAQQNSNLDEAESLLERALAIDPNNPFYLDSLGWVYFRQGKLDQAADRVRQAIYGMDSDDAELREHLGDIYWDMGDKEGAIMQWKRALRLDPSRENVRSKLQETSKE